MGKIVWDPQALEQVHEIYDYYYEHMSPQVVYDLLNDIMNAPDVLENFSNLSAPCNTFRKLRNLNPR